MRWRSCGEQSYHRIYDIGLLILHHYQVDTAEYPAKSFIDVVCCWHSLYDIIFNILISFRVILFQQKFLLKNTFSCAAFGHPKTLPGFSGHSKRWATQWWSAIQVWHPNPPAKGNSPFPKSAGGHGGEIPGIPTKHSGPFSKQGVGQKENKHELIIFGGFLKWWYQTAIGFPTKIDHFGVFWGYHHFRKHPFVSNPQEKE